MSIAKTVIITGIDKAIDDYTRIARKHVYDVKPKEDQIKCSLYHSITEASCLAHIEAAYANGGECDLLIYGKNSNTAIEIKTAWAATDWNNKPSEQERTWLNDINKLRNPKNTDAYSKAYFVLLFAYESNSRAEVRVRSKIISIDEKLIYTSTPVSITSWNGLDQIQYFIYDVNIN